MNGDVMFDLAKYEIAERLERAARHRLAREAAKAAREAARTARGRRGEREGAPPAIPDFAHEMFVAAEVHGPRQETGHGRR